MTLDSFTLTVVTALVIIVSSVVYVVGILLRRDEGAGRVWGLAFLGALVTVVCYLAWTVYPEAWWAVAVGNGTFVAGTGCLWLGSRRFNEHPMQAASVAVAVVSLGTTLAALVPGPSGGAWAGAEVMFPAIFGLAVLGTVETLRGEMAADRNTRALAFVLGVEALYYAARTVAFFVVGPEDEFFLVWLGTDMTGLLAATLSIVAVVVTSVALVGRGRLDVVRGARRLSLSDDDVLPEVSFAHVLLDMCARARRRSELVGVVSLRIDDLPAIATAFGREAASGVATGFRGVVRAFAPTSAFVGQDGETGLLVGIQPHSAADARRIADRIRRGLFDELSGVVGAVIPVVGVGIALSGSHGYEPSELVTAARDAARSAAMRTDTAVVVAGES
jgi:GGDEF domain-containing protein